MADRQVADPLDVPPLGVGLLIRARHPDFAATFQPVATQVSTVAVGFLMVALLVVNFEKIISTVGTGGILAALIVLVGAFAVGFLVGGRPEEQRSVLGLGTAQRNLSAAIVVAAQNFGDDARSDHHGDARRRHRTHHLVRRGRRTRQTLPGAIPD